jgi:hypothetical protein
MPYVTSIERIAMEKGRKEGLQKGRKEGHKEGHSEGERDGLLLSIEMDLELKFGSSAPQLMPGFRAIKDGARLKKLTRAVKSADSLEAVRQLLRKE